LTVSISAPAQKDLANIWKWNAKEKSVVAADRYLAFLESRIYRIFDFQTSARPVPTKPEYKYLVLRRRPKSHGHIVIFKTEGINFAVIRVFHTAQNWQTELEVQ
jgi:plasmid stabilization system protein ParE